MATQMVSPGQEESYRRYLREEEQQKKKDEIFARQFQAQIEAEKKKREKPTLAERIRERAINEGTFTPKDGPVTKAEAINRLRNPEVQKKIQESAADGGERRSTLMGGGRGRGPTDFELAEMTNRAGESLAWDSGESIPFAGYGKGAPAYSDSMLSRARKTGLLLSPEEYEKKRREQGTKLSFDDPSIAGENVSSSQTTGIRSSKGSGRGLGPTEFQMQEMLGQSGEKRDTLMGGGRGEAPTKQQMHELRGEAGEKVNFDEAIYNISQQGDPMDPRARGGDRMTDLKPTSKSAQLKEVDQNNSEITEELIAENIKPGSQEAQDIKDEVGNYMRDKSGAFINLDRVQARLTSLETREDDFKIAQFLQGKNRRKFLENRGYVDPDDIVQPTELEKKTEDLKREVGFLEQEEKLAKLLVKQKRKYKDNPKDDISSEKFLDGAMAALKNGNIDLAKALARKSKISGIDNFFIEKKVDPNAAVKLYGKELLDYVGGDEKDISKFIEGYRTAKNRVIENLSGIIDDSAFITGNSKNKNLYRNLLGIDPNSKPYQTYVENKGYFEISDPGGGEQTKRLEIPRNLNEGQFWQYITEEAVNTHLLDIYPGFHPLHEKVFGRDKGENTVNEFNVKEPGKKIDTGGNQEAGGVLGTSGDPLLERGLSGNSLERVNPGNLNNQENNQPEDLRMLSEEIGIDKFLDQDNQEDNQLQSENQKRNRNFNLMPQAMAGTNPKSGDNMNAPTISSVILSDKSNQEFTFNVLANARKANSNMNAFRRTKRLEGDYTSKVRQEFFEKKKGKKAKPVLSNGKAVYHIGYGIRLPLNKEEVEVLQMNGLSPSQANPFSVKNINNKHIKRLEKIEITEPQALALMQHRYANHIKDLIQATEGQINFANLPNNVRAVIFDMAYNIGPNFLTRKEDPFKNLRASLSTYSEYPTEEQLKKVAEDIKDSKYYRSQVRNRATQNINTLLKQIQN